MLPTAGMKLRMVLGFDAMLAWYLSCPVTSRMASALRILPVLFRHQQTLRGVSTLHDTPSEQVRWALYLVAAIQDLLVRHAECDDGVGLSASESGNGSSSFASTSSATSSSDAGRPTGLPVGGGTTLAFADALITTEPCTGGEGGSSGSGIRVTVRRATGTARWRLNAAVDGMMPHASTMVQLLSLPSLRGTALPQLPRQPHLQQPRAAEDEEKSAGEGGGVPVAVASSSPAPPRIVPESTALRRALTLLDHTHCRETHKVGVLYCRSGGALEGSSVPSWGGAGRDSADAAISASVSDMLLLLEHGSPAFASFLLELGSLAPLTPGSLVPLASGDGARWGEGDDAAASASASASASAAAAAAAAVAATKEEEGTETETPRSAAQREAWERMRRSGQYWGGLDPSRGADGEWALLWQGEMRRVRVAFHVTTLMPSSAALAPSAPSASSEGGGGGGTGALGAANGKESDVPRNDAIGALTMTSAEVRTKQRPLRARSNSVFQQSVLRKKRHIGNDNVLIIFDDDEGEFCAPASWAESEASGPARYGSHAHARSSSGSLSALEKVGSLSSDTNLVHIIASPAGSTHLRIRVRAHPSVPIFGPLCGGTDTILPWVHGASATTSAVASLVRRTAINADTACCVKLRRMGAVASWQARLQQIERVHRHLAKTRKGEKSSGSSGGAALSAEAEVARGADALVELLLRDPADGAHETAQL